MRSVIEEKTSRIVEIIISSVKSFVIWLIKSFTVSPLLSSVFSVEIILFNLLTLKILLKTDFCRLLISVKTPSSFIFEINFLL